MYSQQIRTLIFGLFNRQIVKWDFLRSSGILKFAVVVVVGVLCGVPQSLNATHIVGGEMTYRCLGNNQFEITLVVYRDCFYGDPLAYFDDTSRVGVFDGNHNLVETLFLPFMMVDDTLSGQSSDQCLQIPGVFCVHTTTYRDTVVLDPGTAQGGYTLAYQRCCRNQTIVNIFDPVETGITFTTFISEQAMSVCNSSAVFNDWPPIAICINEPLVYSHAATDADGDSLVYRLCTPFAGGTINDGQPAVPSAPPYDTVIWATPPFSLNNVLGGIPLLIDSETGLMTATPSIIGQFVVGVCVEEYRDGQLLSVTKRDFQYNVTVCQEVSASIVEPDVSCGELKVAFSGQSSGADGLRWEFFSNSQLIGMSDEEAPVFQFPDTGLYTVQLIAFTAEGCADTASTEVFLFDDGLVPDFDVLVLDCGESVLIDVINLTEDPNNLIQSFVWELRTDFNVVVASGYEPQFQVEPFDIPYELTLTVVSENGCVEKDSMILFLKPIGPPDALTDTVTLCKGDTVNLFPVFASGYVYDWAPSEGLSDPGIPNPDAFPTQTTVYTVRISDSTGQCEIERTVTALVIDPVLEVEPVYSCDGLEVAFLNLSQGATSYFWDFGLPGINSDTSSEDSPVFVYPDSSIYSYTLIRTDGPSCGDADTLVGAIQSGVPAVTADFDVTYAGCQTDSVEVLFTDQSTSSRDSIVAWHWFIDTSTFFGQEPPPVWVTQTTVLQGLLIVETAAGCADTVSSSTLVPVVPTDGLLDTIIFCRGDSVALFPGADSTLTYAWFPNDGLNDPTAPNPIATPDIETTYEVQITAPGIDTCQFLFQITVIPSDAPQVVVPPDTLICESEITLLVESVQDADVVWTSPDGDTLGLGPQLTVLPENESAYVITATSGFGCTVSDTVRVEGRMVNQLLSPTDTFVCPGEPVLLSVLNTDPLDSVAWQWSPDSLIAGLSSAQTAEVLLFEPGVYTFQVTGLNQYGCFNSDSAVVTVSPDLSGIDVSAVQECDGYGVQFLAEGPSGISYGWSFGDGSLPVSGEDPFHKYAQPGVYAVTITPGQGTSCADSLIREVTVLDTVLQAGIGVDYEVCSDSGLIAGLFSTSVFSQGTTVAYQWVLSSGEMSNDSAFIIEVSESSVISASLILTTQNGCADTVSQNLHLTVLPVIDFPDTLYRCDTGGVFLNPTGPDSLVYIWSPSSGLSDSTSSNPFANPLVTTTYAVTVLAIGADTCLRTEAVTVVVPAFVNNLFPADTITCSDSINLAVSVPDGGSILWLDAGFQTIGTTPSISLPVIDTALFYLEQTDAFGCSRITDTIRVIREEIQLEITGDSMGCIGEEFLVGLGTQGNKDSLVYTVEVVGGSFIMLSDSLLIITASQPGTFTVGASVANQSGCIDIDTFHLLALDTTSLGGTLSFIQCNDSTVQFQTSHPLGAFFRWHFGDLSNPDEIGMGSEVSYDYPAPGVYEAFVVVDSSVACADTFFFEVDVVSGVGFEFEVGWDYLTCEKPVLVQLMSTSGHSLDSVISSQWLFSSGDTLFGQEVQEMPDSTGNLSYTLHLTTANGCLGTFSDTLFIPEVMIDLEDSVSVCPGGSVFLNPAGDSAYLYSWFPVTSLSDSVAVNPAASPVSSMTYTVDILVPFSNDTCQIQKAVFVEVTDSLEYSLTDDLFFCEPRQVTLQAIVGGGMPADFRWSDDPDFSSVVSTADTVRAQTGRPAMYYVELTDSFGCLWIDSVVVADYSPEVIVPTVVSICRDDTLILSASSLYDGDSLQYFWEPFDSILMLLNDSSISVVPNQNTEFVVEFINQYGCMGADTVAVEVNGGSVLTVTADPDTILPGSSSSLFVSGTPGSTYLWTPADGTLDDSGVANPMASPLQTTVYQVEATDQNGCLAESSVTVFVIERSCIEPYIFIPQAFSPNGDGENDVLFVYGNPIDEIELVIYNRWGEKVFETRDKNFGWDGTYRNERQAPDVFAYYLRVLCVNGEEFVKKGNVTLLR